MRLPRARKRHLLALVLLLPLATMASLPTVHGQLVHQAVVPHYEHGFGWPIPDEPLARGTITDAADDHAPMAFVAATPVAPPIDAAIDIQAVHVDELDPGLLRIRIEVAEIDPAAIHREHDIGAINYDVLYRVGAQHFRSIGTMHSTCPTGNSVPCEDPTTARVAVTHNMQVRDDADVRFGDNIGVAPSRVLPDQNAVELFVPREWLRLNDTQPAPGAGSLVADVSVNAFTRHAVLFGMFDQAPDQGTTGTLLRLATDSYDSVLSIHRHAPPDVEEVGDRVGFNAAPELRYPREAFDLPETFPVRVPLYIQNQLDRKVLATPTIDVPGGSAHTIQVPTSIELPAREMRRIDLVINGTEAIPADAPLVARFHVQPLGTASDIGDRVELEFRSVPRLGPDNGRIFLHATPTRGDIDIQGVSVGGVIDGTLSTLAQHPTAQAETATLNDDCICASLHSLGSDTPTQRPLRLAPAANATMQLTIEAPVPGTLALETFMIHGDQALIDADHDIALDVGTQEISLTLPMIEPERDLVPGHTFDLFLTSDFQRLPIEPFGDTDQQSESPKVHLHGASWLEIPFVAIPEPIVGADHIILSLAPGYDSFQYVNSGRTTLWNVTVLNQGDDNDTVTLSATATNEEWRIRTAPGAAFRLGPGEGVTVGVLASAPDDATEADHVQVNISAASRIASGATSTISARAVVTNNVDIPDVVYTADNDTTSRLADTEKKGSPGPGIAAPLAMIGLAYATHRSRRSAPRSD